MLTDLLPDQFMNWRLVPSQTVAGEFDKVPCMPDGKIVSAHDPANWTTHAAAEASPHGVAFVFTEDDPWFFLDLDKCRDTTGAWSAEAQAIHASFSGAAVEISQSGTGLHIIGKCQKHMLLDRRNKWDGWLEFYIKERFIAFGPTGFEAIGEAFNSEIDWTDQLLHLVPQRAELGELPQGVAEDYTGPEDDDKLIEMILSSGAGVNAAWGNAATVQQLWNADPILCQKYPDYHGDATKFDRSAADAALMLHLAFWTGKDMPRMERLFRRSALMRDKFENRNDYRLKTVQDAAKICRGVYNYKKPEPGALPQAPGEYMLIPQQVEHFAGCVYIRELHRMLVPDGSLLKPDQFAATYGGHVFQMSGDNRQPTKNAFEAFTQNRAHKFPRVKKGIFNPRLEPGHITDDDEVNTFVPATVDIRQGDITPFLDLLQRQLPDPNDRASLLAYCAAVVQYPGYKFQWAPVIQGTEGNGKTFIANCVAHAIGETHTHRPNSKQLGEKFNSYVERSLFVIVEEIDMQGKREMLDILKPLVTNEWIEIRGMQQEKRMARNYGNWFFCTNYMDAVIKSRNDRRYAIYFTAQQSIEDIVAHGMGGTYFPELYRWARSGGYSHVAHYLMNYLIPDELNPATSSHRAPFTSSTHIAISKSIGAVEREILEATEDGTPGFRSGFISSVALEKLIDEKRLRVSRNKRSEILEQMGYVRCPLLPDGRLPRALAQENMKRPTIFVRSDYVAHITDPVRQYTEAQGYFSGM